MVETWKWEKRGSGKTATLQQEKLRMHSRNSHSFHLGVLTLLIWTVNCFCAFNSLANFVFRCLLQRYNPLLSIKAMRESLSCLLFAGLCLYRKKQSLCFLKKMSIVLDFQLSWTATTFEKWQCPYDTFLLNKTSSDTQCEWLKWQAGKKGKFWFLLSLYCQKKKQEH